MSERQAKSPYQRHQKAPHVYSELYRAWRRAVMRGDDDEAERLGAEHTARFLRGAAFVRAEAA